MRRSYNCVGTLLAPAPGNMRQETAHDHTHPVATYNAENLADPTGDWPTLGVLRLRYIHRAIAHANNNKTRAAEVLGIDRRTLNRILARERAKSRAAAGPAASH